MHCLCIIDETTGVCVNRIVIEDGAQWSPPPGTYMVAQEHDDQVGGIGWTHDRNAAAWTAEPPEPELPPNVNQPPAPE